MDKSTEVANQKHLSILVRFYCDKKDSIQTAFLSHVPVIETDLAQILFDKIVRELTAVCKTLKNCIGFASDEATSMVRGKNSVRSRINNDSQNCVQIKCICHSLNSCIEHALSKLTSDLIS